MMATGNTRFGFAFSTSFFRVVDLPLDATLYQYFFPGVDAEALFGVENNTTASKILPARQLSPNYAALIFGPRRAQLCPVLSEFGHFGTEL